MPRKPRREKGHTVDDTLDRLVRVIQWSDGFTLAFVRCNHPVQREARRQKLRERLKDQHLLEAVSYTHLTLPTILRV